MSCMSEQFTDQIMLDIKDVDFVEQKDNVTEYLKEERDLKIKELSQANKDKLQSQMQTLLLKEHLNTKEVNLDESKD